MTARTILRLATHGLSARQIAARMRRHGILQPDLAVLQEEDIDRLERAIEKERQALVGPRIRTASGGSVWPLDCETNRSAAGDLYLDDIAHALGNICRWGGHVREHYSVAQHSVLVSRAVPRRHAAAALLHDAAEAFLGDVVTPLKRMLVVDGEDFAQVEYGLLQAIYRRMGVEWPQHWGEIFHADDAVRAAEARDLMGLDPAEITDATPIGIPINPQPPAIAARAFLARAKELGITEQENP